METLTKPRQLSIFLILMIGTLVYDAIRFIAFDASALATYYKSNVLVCYMLVIVITFFLGYLLYKIYRGRPWARVLWTLLYIFLFLIGLSVTFDYEKTPVVLAFIETIITVAGIIALVLLWDPAITHWLKTMKASHLTTPVSTSSETTKITESDDNSLQTATDSTKSASESANSGISYNKFLKVLRVISAIYVLSITLIFVNIAAIYGLIIHDIAKFPMPQNYSKFANSDRSIITFLLVILLISFVYIIIKNLIDKKLQSYPQEHIDRSYSNKAILFLSFVYVYFFFSLNNRIFVSFFYMTVYLNPNNKPGIVPIISLVLIDLAIIYFVFRYLIKKIEARKTWWIFLILAPFTILFIGATENSLVRLGMLLFADPVIFIINTLKSIFGAAS